MDKSLFRWIAPGPAGATDPRFGMLETVREYGLVQLAASGEAAATRDRHAAWCLDLAERAWEITVKGAVQPMWLARVEAERDNFRAALAWLERDDDATGFVRLAGTLWVMWALREHGLEGRDWVGLDRALARDDVPSAVRARALWGAALIARYRGDVERTIALHEQGLVLWRELHDRWGIAAGLHGLGDAALLREQYDDAEALLTEALALFQEERNEDWILFTQHRLGSVAHARGDLERAAMMHMESLARQRSLEDPWGTGMSLDALGAIAVDRGDLSGAAAHYLASLPFRREMAVLEEYATWLADVAALAVPAGQEAQAARLFAAADVVHRGPIALRGQPWRRRYERATADARAELGDAAFDGAQAAGRVLTLEAAVAEALALLATVSRTSLPPTSQPNDP